MAAGADLIAHCSNLHHLASPVFLLRPSQSSIALYRRVSKSAELSGCDFSNRLLRHFVSEFSTRISPLYAPFGRIEDERRGGNHERAARAYVHLAPRENGRENREALYGVGNGANSNAGG